MIRPDAISIGLAPAGLLGFMFYQYLTLGDPLAMIKASAAWQGTNPFALWIGLFDPRAFDPGNYTLVLILNLAVALLALIAVVPVGRLLGLPYAIFVLIAVVIPLSQRAESLGRYTVVLFPMFIAGAYYTRSRTAFNVVLGGSTLLLSLFTILFANGYPLI